MEYTAPLDTAQVCLTGFRISQIFGNMIPDYSNSTGPLGVQESTNQGPQDSLLSVRLPHIGQH